MPKPAFDLAIDLAVQLDRIRATSGLLRLACEHHAEISEVPQELSEQVYAATDALDFFARQCDQITEGLNQLSKSQATQVTTCK